MWRGIYYIILGVFLFSTNAVNGQKLGLTAGFLLSNANGDLGFESKGKLDIHAGIVAEWELTHKTAFQTGLRYYRKGFRVDLDNLTSLLSLLSNKKNNNPIALSYLEIPLQIKHIISKDWTEFFVQGGPYIGIGLDATSEVFEDRVDLSFGSADDQLKRLALGLQVAFGIEFATSQLAVSYGTDFSNSYQTDGLSLRNSMWAVHFTQFLIFPKDD